MTARILAPLALVVPLLAACALPQSGAAPRPEGVRLSAEVLTLVLSDGSACRVDWAAAPVGRMADCGPGFGYAVTVEDRPNLLRRLVQEVDLAVGGGRLFAPMAEVVITDPAGIDHVFVLPPEPVD
jgi:hypothetical protein